MDALGHHQLLLRARKVESYRGGICPAESWLKVEYEGYL
jgi:hypothetical protein